MKTVKTFDIIRDLEKIMEVYRAIPENPVRSYFLSPGWTETWLRSLPENSGVTGVAVFEEQKPLALFFIGKKEIRRRKVFCSKQFFLNHTGNPVFDNLSISHNGIISAEENAKKIPVFVQMIATVEKDFDEIVLPSIEFEGPDEGSDDFEVETECTVPACYIDLEKVRSTAGGYLSLAARNTRNSYKKTFDILESSVGEVKISGPSTIREALQMFDEMVVLHGARWESKGERGSFVNPYMLSFHRTLIEKRFASGEISLLKTTAGTKTVGIIYSFLYNRRVHAYQCGFAYDIPGIFPGILCHVLGVDYYAGQGFSFYDFLAGNDEYKRRMATGSVTLHWLLLKKPRLKFKVESLCVEIVRFFRRKRLK